MVFVITSLSIPKNLVNLLLPNCSNVLRSSGWNIIIKAITPYVIIEVNIKFNILKFNKSLTATATIKRAIPFNNCPTLDLFTDLPNLYTK